MTVAVNDILRVRATMLDSWSQKHMNVWWCKATGAGTATNGDTFTGVLDMIDGIYLNLMNIMDLTAQTDTLLVDKVSWLTDGWEVIETIGYGAWGGMFIPNEEEEAIAPDKCILLKQVPALRKHQGRKYFGCLTQFVNDNGLVSAAGVLAVLMAGEDSVVGWVVPNSSIVLQMVIPNMSGPATNVYTQNVVGNIFRTQRRRYPDLGI